jgi:cytochrome P450
MRHVTSNLRALRVISRRRSNSVAFGTERTFSEPRSQTVFMSTRPSNIPISDIDPYSDETLIDPWGAYAELQSLGAAVWLTKYQMLALARYDSVLRALKEVSAFSSASGVMMNDDMNQVLRGNTLCSDGADHQRSRRLIGKPLTPTALKSLRDEITSKAERLVDGLVARGTFCAITDLATFLPVDIVASAVGLPQGCGPVSALSWFRSPPPHRRRFTTPRLCRA